MTGPAPSPSDPRRRPFLRSFNSRLLILLLLIISGIHPNPGPTPASHQPSNPSLPPVGIVSWNCNGLKNSCAELSDFLSSRQVKIPGIQETKSSTRAKTPSFPNYAVIRRDRPTGGGGGLISLVHHSVPFVKVPSPINNNTEAIVIEASIANVSFVLANIYVPPQSSCAPLFSASLLPFLVGDFIVVGDINCHNELWSTGAADHPGNVLADKIDGRNAVVLNNPDINTRSISTSSPDITIVPLLSRSPSLGTSKLPSTPTTCPSLPNSTTILLCLCLCAASPTSVKLTGRLSKLNRRPCSPVCVSQLLAPRARKFGVV